MTHHWGAAGPGCRTIDLVRSGLGRAEQGLGELLGTAVAVDVELMTLEPALGLGRLAATPEAEVVGIYVAFAGDLAGHCLWCLDGASADRLAGQLVGMNGVPAALSDSALLEAGNIAVSGLVNGIADRGGWTIHVSPPALARDMLGALVNTVLAAASLTAEQWLAVQGRFCSQSGDVAGTLLLLPDARSLGLLTGETGPE